MSNTKNDFRERPKTFSRLKGLNDGEQVIVVTQAFGPDGESLMHDHIFSGERGICLKVRQGDVEADVVLSPFFGDPSKVYSAPFKEGGRCELLVSSTGTPLKEIPALRTDEGGHYYAIYLSPKLEHGEMVAINDIWGNSHSRLLGEGDMLDLLADLELRDQD